MDGIVGYQVQHAGALKTHPNDVGVLSCQSLADAVEGAKRVLETKGQGGPDRHPAEDTTPDRCARKRSSNMRV